MKKPTISVVVPVYNVAPYIKKCVDSILNQTYQELEIILIDDGSTDESGKICDSFISKDDRISVYHQANQGLSAARNTGMDHATGDWIAFLDSDDWLEPKAYETLLTIALTYDADVSSCLSRDCAYGGRQPMTVDTGDVHIYDDIDQIVFELCRKKTVRVEVWNKLWKRSIVGDIRFVPGQVSEDVHFDRLAFLRINKIAHVNKTLHNYQVGRPGSTNTTFKMARFQALKEYELFSKSLLDMGHKDASHIINSMAIRYILNMYLEAVEKHQSSEVIKRLKIEFSHFYNMNKGTKYLNRAAKTFSASPWLYFIVSEMKTRLKP